MALANDLLEIAVDTARIAGAEVARAVNRAPVSTKSSSTDFVTAVDRLAEELIVRTILDRRPDDSVLGEEGALVTGTTPVRWIIDPIDGTVNYSYGAPIYYVSVAAEVEGSSTAAAVYAPLLDEMFAAQVGLGAHLNGASINIEASERPLRQAVVGTGFGYRSEQRSAQARILRGVLPEIGDIRRVGAAALEICWVASSRTDAYYEFDVQPWDYAAAALVAQEAGAVVSTFAVECDGLTSLVVVSRPEISSGLVRLVLPGPAGEAGAGPR